MAGTTKEWHVHLDLFEEDNGTTKAQLMVDTGATSVTGRGVARCNPADRNIAEIGDELAAGRALRHVAEQLLREAEHEVASVNADQGPYVEGLDR